MKCSCNTSTLHDKNCAEIMAAQIKVIDLCPIISCFNDCFRSGVFISEDIYTLSV